MPLHRMPKLPPARRSEVLCMGAAGVGVLTPLYLVMPGAEEWLARQTTKWAPRWERNMAMVAPRVERTVQRLEPPVSRAVQRVERRLPLEKMAKRVDAGIRRGLDGLGRGGLDGLGRGGLDGPGRSRPVPPPSSTS